MRKAIRSSSRKPFVHLLKWLCLEPPFSPFPWHLPSDMTESTFSLSALESKLVSYITDSSALQKPFDIVSIPKISKEQARLEAQKSRNDASTSALALGGAGDIGAGMNGASGSSPAPAPTTEDTQSLYAQQLSKVPELASYGPVLRSSTKPVELTESETEYVVSAVKHVFKEHIVFQVSLGSELPFLTGTGRVR